LLQAQDDWTFYLNAVAIEKEGENRNKHGNKNKKW
jgi:hypothetical protein